MLANPGPGRLIAFEGLDGSGKSTQVRLLSQRLGATRHVYVTREPTDGPIGVQIRMVLEHRVRVSAATLAALFAADRADHLGQPETGILAHLRRDTDVITDRYYLSSFAYQGMSVDWSWIAHMHAHCVRPELTCFVDVPVEICLARIASGRGGQADLFENKRALTQARESHLVAMDRLRQAGDRIEIIDGNAAPHVVSERIWEIVQEALRNQPGRV
jgi:dTMP kinase